MRRPLKPETHAEYSTEYSHRSPQIAYCSRVQLYFEKISSYDDGGRHASMTPLATPLAVSQSESRVLLSIYCDTRCHSVVCLSVCMCVSVVHPAKAVGRNEMPFGRDTRMVPSNIVLDRGPSRPTERGDLGSKLPVCSDAACCQITLALVHLAIHHQYDRTLPSANTVNTVTMGQKLLSKVTANYSCTAEISKNL